MILPAAECELGLQEQLIPNHQTAGDGHRDRSPDRCFVVMAPLVGGVDASESLLQRKLGKTLSPFLLPGGPIEEPGYFNTVDRQRSVGHHFFVDALSYLIVADDREATTTVSDCHRR
jgi:hypothetical protein